MEREKKGKMGALRRKLYRRPAPRGINTILEHNTKVAIQCVIVCKSRENNRGFAATL